MSNYCNRIDCCERVFIIKQLKEQVLNYEQKDKDYNELQCRYRHLMNE
jgi:hypothetical protein